MSAENRLAELGIVLPRLGAPAGAYVDVVTVNGLAFCSGKGTRDKDGKPVCGKVGAEFSTDQAYQHSRQIGLLLLAALKAELGSLDRVKRIVKILGLVNATPNFGDHPKVINGCSDLMLEVFGDRGKHARSAIGAGSLPNNLSVEIELIAQVE